MDLKTAIYRYCNYQERSHQEVKNKLYKLGAPTPEVEQLMAELIEAGLLNEERYARSFARGRFRLKQWGKRKIIQHLKQQRVSDYCIKKALTEIDPDDYYRTLSRLAGRKWEELKTEKQVRIRQAKVFRYLVQKGFETALISEAINEVMDNKTGV